MKRMLLSVWVLFQCLPSIATAETMSLEQVLKAAMENSHGLKVASHEISIQENRRKSVRGHFLPVLRLDGKVIRFDSDVNIPVDLDILFTLLGDFQRFMSEETLAALAQFQQNGLQLKVRDNLVYEAGLTVAQPIGQLFKIAYAERASKHLTDAARYDALTSRRNLQMDVVAGYMGLIAATKMEETVQAALRQLAEYEKQVALLVKSEVVERNALLKVQVASSDYERKLFTTQKAKQLAVSILNMYMGRSLEAELTPDETEMMEVRIDESLENRQAHAASSRPELSSARSQESAAYAGRMVAIGEMLPELNLVFTYHNMQGTGVTQPENEYFGGLVMSWNIWEWGVSYYKMRAYEATMAKAEEQITEGSDKIRLEVKSKWLELEQAQKDLVVARRQVIQAKENLRIEKLRYDAGDATTSDLLEAQTLHTQSENDCIIAQMNENKARYALLLSQGTDLLNGNPRP